MRARLGKSWRRLEEICGGRWGNRERIYTEFAENAEVTEKSGWISF
jgi:hypothetical protein